MLVAVEDQGADDDAAGRLPAVRPPQDGVDAGDELFDREGLGDIIVGAELQSDDFIGLVPLGRQHDDRERGQRLRPPDLAANLEAVDLGEHEVEQEESGPLPGQIAEQVVRLLESLEAVPGLLETDLQELEDVGFVVEGGDHRSHGLTSLRS